jgi:hypothetical protein
MFSYLVRIELAPLFADALFAALVDCSVERWTETRYHGWVLRSESFDTIRRRISLFFLEHPGSAFSFQAALKVSIFALCPRPAVPMYFFSLKLNTFL